MPPFQVGAHALAPLLAACEAAGFTPRVEQEALQSYTMLSLCAAGFGVTFLPASAANVGMRGVAMLAVDDLPEGTDTHIVAAWHPQASSPALHQLVAALTGTAAPAREPAERR